ncbi:MAG TPA: hypothetical protein VF627_10325 [Abditibacterium sp.]|jgi:hypothetical protein
MNRKLQWVGPSETRVETLLYSGVAFGVVLGAAVSTYVWRQRVKAQAMLNLTPLERAEKLIEACEAKLDSIETTMRQIQEK